MTDEPIIGRWHKVQRRCDYCHKSRPAVYVVNEGPCIGVFCSRQHYELAKNEMKGDKNENS